MSISTLKDYYEKVVLAGQSFNAYSCKNIGSFTISAACTSDLSMLAGFPPANFYASTPLTSAVFPPQLGLRLGPAQPGKTKYLKEMTVSGTQIAAGCLSTFVIDLLLYYPFIDGTITDTQTLINTVSLPRYTTGEQLSMFVVAQGAYTGGATFFVKYTNQAGVSGRISRTVTSNSVGSLGTLINSGTNTGSPIFLQLEGADTGVRSVEEFTFSSDNGGIFSLVICKLIAVGPVIDLNLASINGEKDFLISSFSMPEILEDSVLNFLVTSPASYNARVNCYLKFVWG